jgi:hypothetical protein
MATATPPARSPLEALSRERFQGRTSLSESVVIVPLTPVTLLSGNPNRVSYLIQNRGAASILLQWSPGSPAARGFLLEPNGGWFSMSWEEDGEVTGYEVSGLALVAASTLYVQEVLRA